ncbi:hypothetical protein [Nocardia salmonicida]|uniref:hypothetical protein n=1 Tax=Nocardia salmonicida TaxID=53431 RepID=UPI0033EB6423
MVRDQDKGALLDPISYPQQAPNHLRPLPCHIKHPPGRRGERDPVRTNLNLRPRGDTDEHAHGEQRTRPPLALRISEPSGTREHLDYSCLSIMEETTA